MHEFSINTNPPEHLIAGVMHLMSHYATHSIRHKDQGAALN